MKQYSESSVELLKQLTDQADAARDRLHRAHTVEGVARALVMDCKSLIAVTYEADDLTAVGQLLLVAAGALKAAEVVRVGATAVLDEVLGKVDAEAERVERDAKAPK